MQRQQQGSVECSPHIQQQAKSQQMGELLAAYPRQYKAHPVGIALAVAFIIGIASIAAPLTFLPWTSFLLLLALLGSVTFLLQVRAGRVHQHDQIAIFAQGFLFLEGRSVTAYRWESIQHILRGSAQSEGEGIADIDVIKIKTTHGTFRLENAWEKHTRAAICDCIERGFVSAWLPKIIAQYDAGEEIAFELHSNDFLRVSQSGFRDPKEALPWPMVEKAEVGSELVMIRKEGRTSDWYHKLICTVPNAALLKALLDYRQDSLPR